MLLAYSRLAGIPLEQIVDDDIDLSLAALAKLVQSNFSCIKVGIACAFNALDLERASINH